MVKQTPTEIIFEELRKGDKTLGELMDATGLNAIQLDNALSSKLRKGLVRLLPGGKRYRLVDQKRSRRIKQGRFVSHIPKLLN